MLQLCRGSSLLSRLGIDFPDRFCAISFLAVGFRPPSPNFDLDAIIAMCQKALGTDQLGYWKLFTRDGADTVIQENVSPKFKSCYPENSLTLFFVYLASTSLTRFSLCFILPILPFGKTIFVQLVDLKHTWPKLLKAGKIRYHPTLRNR